MTSALAMLLSLFSVLVPQKMYFTPSQPINVTIKSEKDVTLVLTDFNGAIIAAKGSADVGAGKTADIKTIFPDAAKPGAYILYAVAKGAADGKVAPKDFLGTPIVIESIKGEEDPFAAVSFHLVPLQYAKMTTVAGDMTITFFYDVAPHTADNFIQLAAQGYYDGILFHRVHPGFVIQAGASDGANGGPGYRISPEFSDRKHLPGALSMARVGNDPNSAGSQFFICLNYDETKALDGKYTVFGTVAEGMDTTVKKIVGTKINGESPVAPQTIDKVEVFSVTSDHNPYASQMTGEKPN